MIGSTLLNMAQDVFTALKSVLIKSSIKMGKNKIRLFFYHVILLSQPLMCHPVVGCVCEQVRWCVRRGC